MIYIDNKDKSAIDIDALIKRCRNSADGNIITPEMALGFLKLTNNHANIKFLIRNINAKIKTDEDVVKYKDFVLGAIEGREVTEQTYKMLKDMAIRGGFEAEFNTAHQIDKLYTSDVCRSVMVIYPEEFKRNMEEGIPTIGYFTGGCKEIFLPSVDFTNCQYLFFGRDITRICMNKAVGLKGNLFIPHVCDVEFCGADLSGVKKLYGLIDGRLDLSEAKGLPEIIDVSKARKVRFNKTDLSGVKELKIGECEDISFAFSKGLPEVIDVSQCEEISFHKADVANVKKAYFKYITDAEHFFCWSKNCKASMFYKSADGWAEYIPQARVQVRER